MVEQVPLTTLLSWSWVAFTIEVDNAVEAAGSEHLKRLFRISIAMWANGLRSSTRTGLASTNFTLCPGQVQHWRARTLGIDLCRGGRR